MRDRSGLLLISTTVWHLVPCVSRSVNVVDWHGVFPDDVKNPARSMLSIAYWATVSTQNLSEPLRLLRSPLPWCYRIPFGNHRYLWCRISQRFLDGKLPLAVEECESVGMAFAAVGVGAGGCTSEFVAAVSATGCARASSTGASE